jgi:phosphoglycerate dehydrogenase-like enzyme
MKPKLVLDQTFRKLEELFAPEDYERLAAVCDIVGAVNWPMPAERLDEHLADMRFLVAARPDMSGQRLGHARGLEAIIEVSGRFPETVDYEACFARGVHVLSCAPGFRESVAEMCLGMMIAGARGIVQEHEAFRDGYEHWLDDNIGTDFSLYGATIGFVGYGSIAREVTRLLAPFSPRILAYDPWLKPGDVPGIELLPLDQIMERSRCIVIAATPTDQNKGLVDEASISRMRKGTLVVLISRSHLVDFDALLRSTRERRIRLAVDVFPQEPVALDDAVRDLPNVILSPHRAAAVLGGRHLIGRMIADDVTAMVAGEKPSRLQAARPEFVHRAVGAYATPKKKENADG